MSHLLIARFLRGLLRDYGLPIPPRLDARRQAFAAYVGMRLA